MRALVSATPTTTVQYIADDKKKRSPVFLEPTIRGRGSLATFLFWYVSSYSAIDRRRLPRKASPKAQCSLARNNFKRKKGDDRSRAWLACPSLAVRLSPPVWLRAARDTCNATSLHRRPVILCEILPGPSAAAWAGLGKGFLTGHPPSSHSPWGAPTQPGRQDGREGDWGANKLQTG